ncbi:hypothetical protein, partial [Pseudomonas sp.]|uniref:hypothetical protein n=1 Tax=Pseudomonas sp. TaxID=306 RepID=UPI003A983A64
YAFFLNPLVPPEDRSEGVNLIQDETTKQKKPRPAIRRAGLLRFRIRPTPVAFSEPSPLSATRGLLETSEIIMSG